MLDSEAIKRIQETFEKSRVEVVNGRAYNIHPVHVGMKIINPPTPDTLKINTLSGLIEYLKVEPDLYIHIENYNLVNLVSGLQEAYRIREHHLSAEVNPAKFSWGRYLPLGDFVINLMGCFVQDENITHLLKFLGSVKTEDSLRTDDDGIKQKVTVKSGITTLEVAEVPNPVILRQFVTFDEIEQPEQAYVFRMKKDDQAVSCAMFKTDSLKWQVDCIKSIREYLLEKAPGVKIIS